MSVTLKTIRRDTENFFCNQFVPIFLIAILCTFMTTSLNYALSPSREKMLSLKEELGEINSTVLFEIAQKMPLEQKQTLLHVVTAVSLSNLIGNVILISSVFLMIQLVSSEQRTSTLRKIFSITIMLPKLFILIFINKSLIQIGITLMVIPGILLAISLALSPIMLVQGEPGVFNAMRNSTKMAWNHTSIVVPAVIIWMLIKTLLLLFSSHLTALVPNISTILMNIFNNLISEILLIYLFRFYMLTSQ